LDDKVVTEEPKRLDARWFYRRRFHVSGESGWSNPNPNPDPDLNRRLHLRGESGWSKRGLYLTYLQASKEYLVYGYPLSFDTAVHLAALELFERAAEGSELSTLEASSPVLANPNPLTP